MKFSSIIINTLESLLINISCFKIPKILDSKKDNVKNKNIRKIPIDQMEQRLQKKNMKYEKMLWSQ